MLLDNYTPHPPGSGGIIFKKMEVYFSKIIPPNPVQKINKIIFEAFLIIDLIKLIIYKDQKCWLKITNE